jgi:hypothetical protein
VKPSVIRLARAARRIKFRASPLLCGPCCVAIMGKRPK